MYYRVYRFDDSLYEKYRRFAVSSSSSVNSRSTRMSSTTIVASSHFGGLIIRLKGRETRRRMFIRMFTGRSNKITHLHRCWAPPWSRISGEELYFFSPLKYSGANVHRTRASHSRGAWRGLFNCGASFSSPVGRFSGNPARCDQGEACVRRVGRVYPINENTLCFAREFSQPLLRAPLRARDRPFSPRTNRSLDHVRRVRCLWMNRTRLVTGSRFYISKPILQVDRKFVVRQQQPTWSVNFKMQASDWLSDWLKVERVFSWFYISCKLIASLSRQSIWSVDFKMQACDRLWNHFIFVVYRMLNKNK